MTNAIVRSGLDAYVLSAYPNANYAASTRLRADSGEAESFVFFKSPVPRNATVTSATLRFRNAVAQTGSVTVSAQRIGASWKARRLTWNNKPGVVGSAASATIVNPTTSDWFEIDVTTQLQTIANGAANYGWKIATTFTTLVRLYSLNAAQYKPQLVVEYTDKPDKPTGLVPNGGLAVGLAKPVVQFSYSDPGGNDALDAVQVQINATDVWTSPSFDSGWVTSTDPELDLAATAYAGLADAATTFWRVRVRDDAGGISDWSDSTSFSRDDRGTLTITSPAASPSNFVDEFTPPISWTFTGETQKSYRVLIAKAARPSTWIYDSGRITSTSTSHTLPIKQDGRRVLMDDNSYIVQVRVWDTESRIATPGSPAYASASRTFTVAYDGTVTGATSLTATQPTIAPWVQLDWSRTTTPDEWIIVRDNEVIYRADVGADLLVSGTSYRWTDRTARPLVQHTYKIRAVVNHKTASTVPTANITPSAEGIWLVDDDGTLEVTIGGADYQIQAAYGEDAAARVAIGAQTVARIVAGMRGLEGTISGPIRTTTLQTWDQQKSDLLAMKAAPGTTYRLCFGDENIPVKLGEVSVSPDRSLNPTNVTLAAAFSFWQDGDLPFDAEL